jgi:hypothetical protein
LQFLKERFVLLFFSSGFEGRREGNSKKNQFLNILGEYFE